jgi:anti-sigma factor RsiW
MTCKEALDFLMSYLDGELSAEQRAEFDRHLSICDACRDYLASYQATLKLERAAATTDADAPVPEHLVRAILAARGKSPDRP